MYSDYSVDTSNDYFAIMEKNIEEENKRNESEEAELLRLEEQQNRERDEYEKAELLKHEQEVKGRKEREAHEKRVREERKRIERRLESERRERAEKERIEKETRIRKEEVRLKMERLSKEEQDKSGRIPHRMKSERTLKDREEKELDDLNEWKARKDRGSKASDSDTTPKSGQDTERRAMEDRKIREEIERKIRIESIKSRNESEKKKFEDYDTLGVRRGDGSSSRMKRSMDSKDEYDALNDESYHFHNSSDSKSDNEHNSNIASERKFEIENGRKKNIGTDRKVQDEIDRKVREGNEKRIREEIRRNVAEESERMSTYEIERKAQEEEERKQIAEKKRRMILKNERRKSEEDARKIISEYERKIKSQSEWKLREESVGQVRELKDQKIKEDLVLKVADRERRRMLEEERMREDGQAQGKQTATATAAPTRRRSHEDFPVSQGHRSALEATANHSTEKSEIDDNQRADVQREVQQLAVSSSMAPVSAHVHVGGKQVAVDALAAEAPRHIRAATDLSSSSAARSDKPGPLFPPLSPSLSSAPAQASASAPSLTQPVEVTSRSPLEVGGMFVKELSDGSITVMVVGDSKNPSTPHSQCSSSRALLPGYMIPFTTTNNIDVIPSKISPSDSSHFDIQTAPNTPPNGYCNSEGFPSPSPHTQGVTHTYTRNAPNKSLSEGDVDNIVALANAL